MRTILSIIFYQSIHSCRHYSSNMSLKRKAADVATSDAKKAKGWAMISRLSFPAALLTQHRGSITAFFGAPKIIPKSKASKEAAEFDKDAWVESLTPEQKQLLALEINTLHVSWLAYLKDDLVSKQFLDLKRFLKSEAQSGKKIFPPSADVYSCNPCSSFLHLSSSLTIAGHQGPATRRSTPSKSSSSAKTHTTTTTKRTGYASPCGRRRPRRPRSRTSTSACATTSRTSRRRRRRAGC